MENLPTQSILLLPGKSDRKNYFQSEIFKEFKRMQLMMIKDKKKNL